MSKTLSKKHVIIYVIIFVALAFLIVFFTQKQSTNNFYSTDTGHIRDAATEIEGLSSSSEPIYDEFTPEIKVKSVVTSNTGMSAGGTIAQIDDIDVVQVTDKRVIKTGSIDMRVNSVVKAIGKIKTIALTHGGDEISSDFSKNGTSKNGYIVIKVPFNQYAEALEQIKKIAPLVTHESSQVQDVTAQFIDLESRIKNKKEHEDRLRTFFDKADDVDELIQVERELARVRTEVEQMEGQLKYLKDQTQYSTIHTSLMEDSNIVVSDSWRPLQVVKDSFNTLINKSTGLLNSIIRFTITSLPFIILFIIIAWFLYFTAKHIFKKNTKKGEINKTTLKSPPL